MRSRSTAPELGLRRRPGRGRPTLVLAAIGVLAVGCRREAGPPSVPTVSPPTVPAEPVDEPPPVADAVRLHLSFDDAPWAGDLPVGDDLHARPRSINDAIMATLAAHGVPASVFFNCDRLELDDGSVARWAAAGHEVGNHTSSHANLAKTPLPEWIDDVRRCHEVLAARLPAPPRWFRYPYLSEGDSLELRDRAREQLGAMGYTNAHVTVATTEWLLAFAYRRAKAEGDEALMAELVAAYRTHMLEAVEQARELARAEVGRETTQVVLFHVNELAADHLADVIADYRAQGFVLVGLAEALADPVFELPDHYVGRGGLSWLARIHEDPSTRPPYWFGHEEGRLMERYGALLQVVSP